MTDSKGSEVPSRDSRPAPTKAGKLRSNVENVSEKLQQLKCKEEATEEDIDAELQLAREKASKRSLCRSFGFRSKKDVIGTLNLAAKDQPLQGPEKLQEIQQQEQQ